MTTGASPRCRLGLAVVALALVAGCSKPTVAPVGLPPYRNQVSATYDVTWNALIRALAIENVPLRTVARDSGIIASDDFVTPIGVYADCGRKGDAPIEGEALVAYTLFVTGMANGTTDIQVNANMRRLKTDQIYKCVSTGRWEANLMDTVRRLAREGR